MRISERVTWPVEWPKDRWGLRSLGAAAMSVGGGTVDVLYGGDAGPHGVPRRSADSELPEDPTLELALERLTAEGEDGVLRDVILTQRSAQVEGAPSLDLLRAFVVAASTSEEKDPHLAAAHWELTVDVDGTSLTLYGPWATFAWLGHLARWPVPVSS